MVGSGLLPTGLPLVAQSSKSYEYMTLQDKRTIQSVSAGQQPWFTSQQVVVGCTKPKDVKNGKTCWKTQLTDLNTLAEKGWQVASQSGAAPRACGNTSKFDCPEFNQAITFVFRRENKQ
jgi:hypothetical protein